MTTTDEFAYPGKEVSVIEEFIPSYGTYAEDEGFIRAKRVGQVRRDLERRTVEVEPHKEVEVPGINDEVMGVVAGLTGIFGSVRIEVLNDKVLRNPWRGVLYPTLRRTEKRQFLRGDVVLAYVESTKNRTFHLFMKGSRYGVVKARCFRCGSEMKVKRRESKTVLKCPACWEEDGRKVSSLYGRML